MVQPGRVRHQVGGRLDQLRAAVHQVARLLVDERELPLDPDRRPGGGMEVDAHATSEAHGAPDRAVHVRVAVSMATMLDTRTLNLTLDFCLRVGELLLSSGAGAADVTATMRALELAAGRAQPRRSTSRSPSLSMSYQPDPEEPMVIQVRHVKQRDIDYEDLTLVDHLVRDVVVGRVELAEARADPGPDRLVGPQPAALGGHASAGA